MQPAERRRLTSHGLDRSVTSWVLQPTSREDVLECLEFARTRRLRICPAGGRNSFGDVFLLGDHLSLDMTRMDRVLSFDELGGRITVEAGALEPAVIAQVMPAGWQLPAGSGSLWNTIAGDLSSNINGKDTWKLGAFGDQVESCVLVLANGETRRVDRGSDAPLFDAVVGGLGLLGVVVDVTLRLQPIPSVMLECDSRPVRDLDEMVAHFASLDPAMVDFSYAWVDAYAEGSRLGRGICESARFVSAEPSISPEAFRRGFVPRRRIYGLSPELFWGTVRRVGQVCSAVGPEGTLFRTLNAIKYAHARWMGPRRTLVAFPDFQYPMVGRFPFWNRKFAPHGFNEVQALFPTGQFEAGFRALRAVYRAHGRIPEVCAIRRHRADVYPLSFAGDGLSVTFPFALAGFAPAALEAFRHEVVEAILRFGGKVYLSKFPYLEPGPFRQMYPGQQAFREVKARVDPGGVFWSETAARLLT